MSKLQTFFIFFAILALPWLSPNRLWILRKHGRKVSSWAGSLHSLVAVPYMCFMAAQVCLAVASLAIAVNAEENLPPGLLSTDDLRLFKHWYPPIITAVASGILAVAVMSGLVSWRVVRSREKARPPYSLHVRSTFFFCYLALAIPQISAGLLGILFSLERDSFLLALGLSETDIQKLSQGFHSGFPIGSCIAFAHGLAQLFALIILLVNPFIFKLYSTYDPVVDDHVAFPSKSRGKERELQPLGTRAPRRELLASHFFQQLRKWEADQNTETSAGHADGEERTQEAEAPTNKDQNRDRGDRKTPHATTFPTMALHPSTKHWASRIVKKDKKNVIIGATNFSPRRHVALELWLMVAGSTLVSIIVQTVIFAIIQQDNTKFCGW